jgi:hypothetical protein
LLHTTNGDEMTQKKKGFHLKILLFSCMYVCVYIHTELKLYKILFNYHPKGDLVNHPYFLFIENLEAIKVDKN